MSEYKTVAHPEIKQEIAQPDVWRKAYKEVLLEHKNSRRAEFQFVYINDDDIPELMIYNAEEDVLDDDLFTYYAGDVRWLGTMGEQRMFSYGERNNNISYHDDSERNFEVIYGELTYGTFTVKYIFTERWIEREETQNFSRYYALNELEITEKEHDEWVEQYRRKYMVRKTPEYSTFDLTEENIEKAFDELDGRELPYQ